MLCQWPRTCSLHGCWDVVGCVKGGKAKEVDYSPTTIREAGCLNDRKDFNPKLVHRYPIRIYQPQTMIILWNQDNLTGFEGLSAGSVECIRPQLIQCCISRESIHNSWGVGYVFVIKLNTLLQSSTRFPLLLMRSPYGAKHFCPDLDLWP